MGFTNLIITWFGNESIKIVRRIDSKSAIINENSDQQMIFNTIDNEQNISLKPSLDKINLSHLMPKNYHFYGLDLVKFDRIIEVMTAHFVKNFSAEVIDVRGLDNTEKMKVYPVLGTLSSKEYPTFVIDTVNRLQENLQAFNNQNCYLILVNSYEDNIPAKFIDSAAMHSKGINLDLEMVYFDNNKLFQLG